MSQYSRKFSYNKYTEQIKEKDKSSCIEQQPPFGDRKYSKILPQKRGVKKERIHFGITTIFSVENKF